MYVCDIDHIPLWTFYMTFKFTSQSETHKDIL